MPSEEDYDSDYDTRPEAGRAKQHLNSDESDNEHSSSGSRRPPPFLNDDADDDDDPPVVVEETKRERSTSTPTPTAVNPIRQPTAFAAPNPGTTIGPTFYKTPTHATVSADGTSMFCVEGYVNTPELSAGRGGGLTQGLPANGPYKSLFRARSESRGSNKTTAVAASAIAPDAALHVLADAAQSPEALSPVSTASPAPALATTAQPAPVPATTRKRRKPSPLVASSPASSVAPLDSTSAVAQPSPVPSTAASSSRGIEPSPPRPSRAKARGGGPGKGKHKEKAPPVAATRRRSSTQATSGDDEQRYRRHALPRPQQGPPFSAAEPREAESRVKARPRGVQKSMASDDEEVVSVPPPSAPANDDSYDHAGAYYPSYYEAGPSDARNAAVDTVREGGQSHSPSPSKIWESPRPSPSVANHYPASTHTTSKESSPALAADSRSQTPGTKPRMLTLLIEDRRHGTDELVEVHVPFKSAGEGNLWADAKDVCTVLQSGPSRIDGPAKVFTMRGKYRQTFLRVSADGEETNQSANLKVETNKTLSIVVEGISDPRVVMPAHPNPLVTTRSNGPSLNTAHPLTPVSTIFDLDGIHSSPLDHDEAGQWSGGARKRKRETSLGHIQHPLFNSTETRSLTKTIDASNAARTMHSSHTRPWKTRRSDPISSFDGGYMSDLPPAAYRGQRIQRKDQIASESRSRLSGYETDRPLPSIRARGIMTAQEQHQGSGRRVSSLLQPPPAPIEGSQRMHDKVVSFLQENFMEDILHWNEFARNRAHVGSLSNATLLRTYWFAQGRLDTWVGSRLPRHLNYKKVEIRDALDALGVTEEWYRECNETLSLLIAYGERGERCENARAVAASRDRTPKSLAGSSGPTDLLVLLRQVHEEYCEARIGQSQEGSIETSSFTHVL